MDTIDLDTMQDIIVNAVFELGDSYDTIGNPTRCDVNTQIHADNERAMTFKLTKPGPGPGQQEEIYNMSFQCNRRMQSVSVNYEITSALTEKRPSVILGCGGAGYIIGTDILDHQPSDFAPKMVIEGPGSSWYWRARMGPDFPLHLVQRIPDLRSLIHITNGIMEHRLTPLARFGKRYKKWRAQSRVLCFIMCVKRQGLPRLLPELYARIYKVLAE